MSGTIEPSAEEAAASEVLEPSSRHFDADTSVVSKPGSEAETSRDPRATLTMTSNLNSFLHKAHR